MIECERCKGNISIGEDVSTVTTEHGNYYVCEGCAEEVLR